MTSAVGWVCQDCKHRAQTQHDVIEHKLDHVIDLLRQVANNQAKMMTDQQHLDEDVQELGTALSTIADEIAALKGQPGATALDFSALDAVVAQAQGLATPPAPSAPADGTADGTTATA